MGDTPMRTGFNIPDGCRSCPVKNCEIAGRDGYRGSICVVNRSKAGVDFDPMTHGEQLARMSAEELSTFLVDITVGGERPWCDKGKTGIYAACLSDPVTQRKCITDWLRVPAHETDSKEQ